MKRHHSIVIVALVGALTLGLYVTAGGQAGGGSGGAEPTRVAVVNMQQVINQSAQQTAFMADNQRRADTLKTEQQRRQQEIATITNAIDPLQPGSDAWNQKRDELQTKTLELEVWARMQEQNGQLEQARQFATLYRGVNEASAAVAEAMGYDVVLQGGELPDLMRLNVQQLQTVVQTRKVIHYGDAVDITPAVLQRVNDAFGR
ncbi:MAG: OmpH family outer membrane protein [Planctomycetota bacterium]